MNIPSRLYHPSTLSKIKGKYYVVVTKPQQLQQSLKDKQRRKSTGTADITIAKRRQHQITEELYAAFDQELGRLDPFFESVKHLLQAEGVRTQEWYDKGSTTIKLMGDKTLTSKLGWLPKRSRNGEPLDVVETLNLRNHLDLCRVLSLLGHAIPTAALSHLSTEDRERVIEATVKKPLTLDDLHKFYQLAEEAPYGTLSAKHVQSMSEAFESFDDTVKVEGAITPASPALADVLDEYLKSRSDRQQQTDLIQLRKWCSHPTFGPMALHEVTHYDAQEFLVAIGGKLTESSVKVCKSALSNVWQWALLKRDLDIHKNPFKLVALKGVGQKGTQRRPFTESELSQIFSLDLSVDERAALTILATTGMRGGELMQIEKASEQDGIRFMDLRYLSTVKNNGSRRMVPLHDASLGTNFPLKTDQDKLNALIDKVNPSEEVSLHSLSRHLCR